MAASILRGESPIRSPIILVSRVQKPAVLSAVSKNIMTVMTAWIVKHALATMASLHPQLLGLQGFAAPLLPEIHFLDFQLCGHHQNDDDQKLCSFTQRHDGICHQVGHGSLFPRVHQ